MRFNRKKCRNRRADGEDDGASIRKYLWPAMTALRRRKARERRRIAARRRKPHEGRVRCTEDDRIVWAPRAAARIDDIAKREWGATTDGHSFQLAPGEEGHPSVVIRKERL